MKAIRIVEPYKVEICDIAEPKAGPEDIIIKVKALGLCGSDLATYRGLNPMVSYPRIPGHEIAGEIVDKDSNVPADFAVGASVTISPYTACQKCPACRKGRVNCCQYNQTMGVQRDGAATQYIAVPYQKVFQADGFSYEQTVCIEPLSVGWHAINRAEVSSEDTVLVLGCGVIGLGAAAASAFKNASVIAVDIDDGKLEKAKKLGATYVINSTTENLEEKVNQITSGDGPGVVVEAIGLSQTFTKAVEIVSFAGRVVYIGYPKEKVEYEAKLFVSKELDIKGSRNAFNSEIYAVIDMLKSSKIDIASLVTQRFIIDETAMALDFWDKNTAKVTKIVVLF